jgi:rhodanese-related sulfurtransferase
VIEAKFIREAAVLPIAALLLGLVYNSFSPLGVRLPGAAASSRSPVIGDRGTAADTPVAPVAAPDPDLRNETLTAAIVPGGADGISAEPPHQAVAALKWGEVKALLAKHEALLVDGRDSLAYEAGHIPGAISLPLRTVTEKIGELTAKYPKNTALVIYCASPQCAIAHQEARLLAEQYGYTNVREMPGGYAEWLAAESKETTAAGGQP